MSADRSRWSAMRPDRTSWKPTPYNPKAHPPISWRHVTLPGQVFDTRASMLEAVSSACR
jgi:hypothetical protein